MANFPSRPSLFSRTLRECRKLYVSSGELVMREHRALLADGEQDYVELMDDLHRALVLKIYLVVCEADREWSKQERFLAEVLCHHLFGQWLSGQQLRETMKKASAEALSLKWYSLVRPFDRVAPLRDRVGRLETIVSRLANLVARCDGTLNDQERGVLKSIEEEIASHLRKVPVDEIDDHDEADQIAKRAIEEAIAEAPDFWSTIEKNKRPDSPKAPTEKRRRKKTTSPGGRSGGRSKAKLPSAEPPEISVEDALAELDRLIGLGDIKREVRSLTNFLKLQQKREDAGLPETDISLHMVFTGNPGTGKTTVARIVGKIFRALGVLEKGHLIETDRSGLVAEYAGQTGPKTNKCVDSALDGLLFIDEAYSLVASQSEDPYGREAVQALLKRAEDDRERIVVILAGYPREMQTLLRSNPGLSSRFSRQLDFDDYTPLELAKIFGLMCRKNHYEVTSQARLKVLLGLDWAYRHRDRHFGNGRASRNLFEHAVRRMANRLADDADITQQELMTLEGEDIEFEKVPAAAFELLDESKVRLKIACPECEHSKQAPTEFLGKKVRCPKCETLFAADWGELVASGEEDASDAQPPTSS